MTSCGHTFAWNSVLPPSHCPVCGACLHCHAPRPVPVMPYPSPPIYPRPWPYGYGPYYSTICSSNTTAVAGGTPINAMAVVG